MATAISSVSAVVIAVAQRVPVASPIELLKSVVVGKETKTRAENDLENEKTRIENELVGKFPAKEDIVGDLEMNLLMIDGCARGFRAELRKHASAPIAPQPRQQVLEKEAGALHQGRHRLHRPRERRRRCGAALRRRAHVPDRQDTRDARVQAPLFPPPPPLSRNRFCGFQFASIATKKYLIPCVATRYWHPRLILIYSLEILSPLRRHKILSSSIILAGSAGRTAPSCRRASPPSRAPWDRTPTPPNRHM